MILPYRTTSSLPLFFLMSLGIHIIGLSFFVFLSPKFIEKQSTKITINVGNNSSFAKTSSTKETQPVVKKSPAKTLDPIIEKVPIVPIAKEIQPIVKTSPTTPTIKTPTKEAKPIINEPTPSSVAKVIPKEVKKISKTKSQQNLASELDKLLNKKVVKKSSADFLANATWSGTPRKTITFPKLAAHIPQQYKSRGYGFSVTAKITFSPQGWVSSVQLVHTSGDPRIDNIFRTELRKIRIEESKKQSYDTIIKTFTVSVK